MTVNMKMRIVENVILTEKQRFTEPFQKVTFILLFRYSMFLSMKSCSFLNALMVEAPLRVSPT